MTNRFTEQLQDTLYQATQGGAPVRAHSTPDPDLPPPGPNPNPDDVPPPDQAPIQEPSQPAPPIKA